MSMIDNPTYEMLDEMLTDLCAGNIEKYDTKMLESMLKHDDALLRDILVGVAHMISNYIVVYDNQPALKAKERTNV